MARGLTYVDGMAWWVCLYSFTSASGSLSYSVLIPCKVRFLRWGRD